MFGKKKPKPRYKPGYFPKRAKRIEEIKNDPTLSYWQKLDARAMAGESKANTINALWFIFFIAVLPAILITAFVLLGSHDLLPWILQDIYDLLVSSVVFVLFLIVAPVWLLKVLI